MATCAEYTKHARGGITSSHDANPDDWPHEHNLTNVLVQRTYRRGMSTVRKFVLALVALAVVVLVAIRVLSPSSSPSTPSSTSTSRASSTWMAVWPTSTSSPYVTPAAAARSFAVHVLSMADPILERYRAGDARSGEIPIRATPTGPVTTVLVRQLARDTSWWVLGAVSNAILIDQPSARSTIRSPFALAGQSTAFEAVVNVTLRSDALASPLVQTTVMGGANGVMGPFHATLHFASPSSRYGVLVLFTRSAKDGSVTEASAIRVRFA